MSGGGGGGGDWRPTPTPISRPGSGGGNGGGNGSIPDKCQIEENTPLNSVDAKVLASVKPNEILSVEFQAGPPIRLVAKTSSGQILGSITSANMMQIIECIEAGVEYQAQIVSIRGAQCQVKITPKRP